MNVFGLLFRFVVYWVRCCCRLQYLGLSDIELLKDLVLLYRKHSPGPVVVSMILGANN
jgi:hypothetical protein